MHLGRRASVVRTVVTAALGVALIGCGTEPSDFEPGVYRLAAADSLTTDNLPCFASSSHWSGGRLDYQGTCDIALRSLQARFDSTGPVPELVVTARLRLRGGDTTVWEAALPAGVRNGTVQYDAGAITGPIILSDEQLFILPIAGTLVRGVLTLLLSNHSGNGALTGEGPEYVRTAPTVFILTASGGLPTSPPLAPRYEGFSFNGSPTDDCPTEASPPGSCRHYSFTLAASGSAWAVDYHDAVTVGADTLGASSLHIANLTITQSHAFVRASSGSEPQGSPLRFDALGSVVGGTLTLFTNYWFLDGRPLASPIVLNSE